MLAVYNATDVLVLSSAYGEGFSNALGEAMACGVPCVATDVGDTARLIGSLGEVVPPKDSAELKRGISTLLNRLENETDLNSEIVQRIVDQFSVAKLISTTVETLEEVLAAKSGEKNP
jgi:glycosyltransferase involved in cell wall biosynthesis